jgi:transposase
VNEQEHQKKAFEFYYGLGEGRSYKQVAREFGVSLGTVKVWGREFSWKRRVSERDAEVGRAIADQTLEDMTGRLARNRKLVKIGLVQVAKAIAEGKVKLSVADLDRLIRLEGFLREEEKVEGTKIILEWSEYDGKGEKVGDVGDAGSDITEETD